MTDLEKKKKLAEILKMKANIMDNEVKIEERLIEIQRIKDQNIKYDEHIAQLEEQLSKE